ncbi:hypothetical protein PRIPAC_77135 [Pristionchus pacificus]|uniref:Transmembrane ion channel n=1 Tax=Pristionchus pacificus TaxID=54126 RepID=A0A2A6BVG2_PRIPA|nr:hypothetical protein PRIPAC_77135 [Pristionchus pacificus]|eukprot:PDM69875.1 transmembrane ion channel [Pristionchus pacificus]
MVSLILLSVLLSPALAIPPIKCYSCILPPNVADFAAVCNQTNTCTGNWCTKGPDARSSGILYGCMDTAPVDVAKSTCKMVKTERGTYANCYCNNIEYCNGGGMDGLLNTVLSLTHILHIPTMDENEQSESVDVHGAVHFKWTSPHYVWNGTKYDQVNQISRMVGEYLPYKPWTPKPNFEPFATWLGREKFEQPDEFDTFVYEEASQLTINSDGSMILSVPFSLRLPCNFDFSSFPNDEHLCVLVVQTMHALELTFKQDESITAVWSAAPNKRTGDFVYRMKHTILDQWKQFSFVGEHSTRVHHMEIGIAFTRQPHRYYERFHYPLTGIVLMSQYAVTIGHDYLRESFVLLFFIIFAFMNQLSEAQDSPSKVTIPFLKRTVEIYDLISWTHHITIGILTSVIVIGAVAVQSR